MEANKEINKRFLAARKTKNMEQKEAAEKLGISASYLSYIEKGKKRPNVDLILKASKVYGVSPGYFFEIKNPSMEKLDTAENREFISDLNSIPGYGKRGWGMYTKKEVGMRIRYLREQRDLSLRDLGEALKMDYSYLGKIERGFIPSLKTLNKISSYFNVDVSYLLGRSNQQEDGLQSRIGLLGWYSFIEEAERKRYTPEELIKLLDVLDELKVKG